MKLPSQIKLRASLTTPTIGYKFFTDLSNWFAEKSSTAKLILVAVTSFVTLFFLMFLAIAAGNVFALYLIYRSIL